VDSQKFNTPTRAWILSLRLAKDFYVSGRVTTTSQ
jgi:hypothetical protein